MFIHEFKKRIRYGETDKMGYLYYGNYPFLYEIGRTEALRSIGIQYKHMEDELGIMMPVIHVESRYKSPIYYDEQITIRTILKSVPTKLIEFEHEILNEDLDVVHRGRVILFFVDKKSNKRVSCPTFINEKIISYFE